MLAAGSLETGRRTGWLRDHFRRTERMAQLCDRFRLGCSTIIVHTMEGLYAVFGAGRCRRDRAAIPLVADCLDGLGFRFRAARIRALEGLHTVLCAGRCGRDRTAVPLVAGRLDGLGFRFRAARVRALEGLHAVLCAGRCGRNRTVVPLVAECRDRIGFGLRAAGHCAAIYSLSVLRAGRRRGRSGVPDMFVRRDRNGHAASANAAENTVFVQIVSRRRDRHRAGAERRAVLDLETHSEYRPGKGRCIFIVPHAGRADIICSEKSGAGVGYLFQNAGIIADTEFQRRDRRVARDADGDRHLVTAAAAGG